MNESETIKFIQERITYLFAEFNQARWHKHDALTDLYSSLIVILEKELVKEMRRIESQSAEKKLALIEQALADYIDFDNIEIDTSTFVYIVSNIVQTQPTITTKDWLWAMSRIDEEENEKD